jgi:hypothetical protein
MSWNSCSFLKASSVTHDFTELRDEVGSQFILLPPMATRAACHRRARVHAKAIHVSNLVEYVRRYGALKSTKMVAGTLVDVEVDGSGKRSNCFLTVEWELGGGCVKKARLNVRSVYNGEPAIDSCNLRRVSCGRSYSYPDESGRRRKPSISFERCLQCYKPSDLVSSSTKGAYG